MSYIKLVHDKGGLFYGFYRQLCNACGPLVKGARKQTRRVATDGKCSECGAFIERTWKPESAEVK